MVFNKGITKLQDSFQKSSESYVAGEVYGPFCNIFRSFKMNSAYIYLKEVHVAYIFCHDCTEVLFCKFHTFRGVCFVLVKTTSAKVPFSCVGLRERAL